MTGSAPHRWSPGLWLTTASLIALLAVGWRVAAGPERPYSTSRDVLHPPGPAHWLGTNDIGQDVLAGLVVGLPGSVFIPLVVALICLLLAGAFAALAALRGGFIEAAVLRGVEILQVLPSMFLLLLLATWIRPSFAGVVALLALTSWHDDVRVLRAIILRETTRESLCYARVNGASWPYCLVRHVLPSVWPAVMAIYVQNVRGGVMKVAGLGFLGLIDPRLVTWGAMMQDALPYLYGPAWLWLLLPAAAILSLFLGGLILVGQRLEERALAGSAGLR